LREFDEAVARIPRWMLLLAVAGTVVALLRYGLSVTGGFLVGAIAAWVNFRVIEGVASRVTNLAQAGQKAGGGTGVWAFIQFIALVLAALAILFVSGFSRPAAFCGLMIVPAAVMLEMVYELVTFRHK
jgi:hypothetical protein